VFLGREYQIRLIRKMRAVLLRDNHRNLALLTVRWIQLPEYNNNDHINNVLLIFR